MSAYDQKVQFMMRFDPDVKAWLDEESLKSGRSLTWLVEHAVNLWKKRLQAQRRATVSKSIVKVSR